MWYYVKTLQYPVNLKCKDLNMAKLLVTQYGGPDGELGAALRYLDQRYTMPTGKSKGLLTDIGTEEMAHVEIIATMVYQLMENATMDEIKKAGLAGHYADHRKAVFYTDATGNPCVTKQRHFGMNTQNTDKEIINANNFMVKSDVTHSYMSITESLKYRFL